MTHKQVGFRSLAFPILREIHKAGAIQIPIAVTGPQSNQKGLLCGYNFRD
jgi:hypothetical protein